jgi:hypothetical protein
MGTFTASAAIAVINDRPSGRVVSQGLVLANIFTVSALYATLIKIKEKGLLGLALRIMTPGAGQRAAGKK